jgi:hypothetical protein
VGVYQYVCTNERRKRKKDGLHTDAKLNPLWKAYITIASLPYAIDYAKIIYKTF